MLAAADEQGRQSVQIFSFIARDHPDGGDALRSVSLSLRYVEDLLFERGYDFCLETVRLWWNRFGPMFAAEIRGRCVSRMRGFRHWRWHLDEMYVKMNGEMVYLWRAVDHEGEVLESFVTKKPDKSAALAFMKKALKRHGKVEAIVTYGFDPTLQQCATWAISIAAR